MSPPASAPRNTARPSLCVPAGSICCITSIFAGNAPRGLPGGPYGFVNSPYMCDIVADSLPRSSPMCPFVSTQTTYEPGFAWIILTAEAGTVVQLLA